MFKPMKWEKPQFEITIWSFSQSNDSIKGKNRLGNEWFHPRLSRPRLAIIIQNRSANGTAIRSWLGAKVCVHSFGTHQHVNAIRYVYPGLNMHGASLHISLSPDPPPLVESRFFTSSLSFQLCVHVTVLVWDN